MGDHPHAPHGDVMIYNVEDGRVIADLEEFASGVPHRRQKNQRKIPHHHHPSSFHSGEQRYVDRIAVEAKHLSNITNDTGIVSPRSSDWSVENELHVQLHNSNASAMVERKNSDVPSDSISITADIADTCLMRETPNLISHAHANCGPS